MAFDFNADDIFEMAEQIEKNGADFYQKASDTISDSYYKKMLLDLSTMELYHQRSFATMRSALTEKEKKPTVFDPTDEAALYLKALADMRVFYEKKMDMSSLESIFNTAITAEKDSIVFYLGIKDLVPDRLGKDKIDKIINEEKKHLLMLTSELISLKKG